MGSKANFEFLLLWVKLQLVYFTEVEVMLSVFYSGFLALVEESCFVCFPE